MRPRVRECEQTGADDGERGRRGAAEVEDNGREQLNETGPPVESADTKLKN